MLKLLILLTLVSLPINGLSAVRKSCSRSLLALSGHIAPASFSHVQAFKKVDSDSLWRRSPQLAVEGVGLFKVPREVSDFRLATEELEVLAEKNGGTLGVVSVSDELDGSILRRKGFDPENSPAIDLANYQKEKVTEVLARLVEDDYIVTCEKNRINFTAANGRGLNDPQWHQDGGVIDLDSSKTDRFKQAHSKGQGIIVIIPWKGKGTEFMLPEDIRLTQNSQFLDAAEGTIQEVSISDALVMTTSDFGFAGTWHRSPILFEGNRISHQLYFSIVPKN